MKGRLNCFPFILHPSAFILSLRGGRDLAGFGAASARGAPLREALFGEREYCAAVVVDELEPSASRHLWEVDAPEEEARDEHAYAVLYVVVADGPDRARVALGAVGPLPSTPGLQPRLLYRHLQRRVRHHERREVQPVLRPRQPPRLPPPLVP